MSSDEPRRIHARRSDPGERPLAPAVEALVLLANQTLPTSSRSELAARWQRMKLAGLVRPQKRRAPLYVALTGVAAAAAIIIAVAQRNPDLAYEVSGTTVLTPGYVQSDGKQNASVRFSDGSDVSLSGGARMRLESVRADAPRLVLEDGEARVHVFHREGSRWSLHAGPFRVLVTGTSFVLGWNAGEQRLNLRLESGSVKVSGPLGSDELTVREGQVLSVGLRENEVFLRQYRDEESPPDQSPPSESKPPPPRQALPTSRAPPSLQAPPAPVRSDAQVHKPSEARNWGRKLSSGRAALILEEARAQGIDQVLNDSSSADLEALADAARYSGAYDLGRNALLAERRRFPGAAGAERAALFLGRVDEAAGRWPGALDWYETYLRESPSGTYASEALAGKMVVVQRLNGNAKARGVAEEYLRRFPDGSHANAARVLLSPR